MSNNRAKIIAAFIISFIIIIILLKIFEFNGVTETLSSIKVDSAEDLERKIGDTIKMHQYK